MSLEARRAFLPRKTAKLCDNFIYFNSSQLESPKFAAVVSFVRSLAAAAAKHHRKRFFLISMNGIFLLLLFCGVYLNRNLPFAFIVCAYILRKFPSF